MNRVGLRYRRNRARERYDVIVIGSGIGGLGCAALLSKLGRSVCVLEQHYTAGGFTHSYERNGYEWDVGVHYIGEVHKPHSPLRRLFDVISDGAIRWAPMDPVYDRIVIDDRRYDFHAGSAQFAAELKLRFPGEAQAIDRYVLLVREVAASATRFFASQAMPRGLAAVYNRLRGLLLPRECLMSVREVLESLTGNQELIAVLTGQWGDYGMVPAQATFLMHAAVAKHYFAGGNYPVGGAQTIAEHIAPVIRAGGGEVFTYARVKQILVEDDRTRGVVMDNGDVLRADCVVSDAGAMTTYGDLLPEPVRRRHGYERKLARVKPSSAHLCLYAGFKGTAQQLGIPRTNLWIYPGPDHEANVQRFYQDPERELPMVYISFPSAKDPEWERHYPGRSTVEVLTVGPYEWFERWAGTTWNDRGADYEAFKAKWSQRLLAALFKQMPQLEAALDYFELSTPLSTQWFEANRFGEIYGLEHEASRFRQNWLHPRSAVEGLWLTGQDVVTAGVGGALMGGLLTTMAMLDLRTAGRLQRMLKQWRPPAAAASTAPAAA